MGNSWDRKTFAFVFSKQERSRRCGPDPVFRPRANGAGEGKILYIFLIKHYIFINVQLVHCIPRVGGCLPHAHPARLVPLMCLVWQAGIVLELTLLYKNPEPRTFSKNHEDKCSPRAGVSVTRVPSEPPCVFWERGRWTTEAFSGRCSGEAPARAPHPCPVPTPCLIMAANVS